GAHVATDHPLGQTRLKRLVDDAAAGAEICLATRHEGAERQFFRHATPRRLQHPHEARLPGCRGYSLDFPHALAPIASVLLQDARARRLQPCRELGLELGGSAIEVGVGAPAEMPG